MQINLTEKTLSLFGNTEVGDYVRYPHGRLCFIDMLTACARCTENIYFQVGGVDIQLNLVRFG